MLLGNGINAWILYWNLLDIIIAMKSIVKIANKTANTIVRGNIGGCRGAPSQDKTVRSIFAATINPSYVTTIRVHDS